ncbi:hypothetical protein BaRGS_00007018, partial [Batillaria attramentaria]
MPDSHIRVLIWDELKNQVDGATAEKLKSSEREFCREHRATIFGLPSAIRRIDPQNVVRVGRRERGGWGGASEGGGDQGEDAGGRGEGR